VSAGQIIRQIRPQLSRLPGFEAFPTLPPAINVGGRASNSTYQLIVRSADTSQLYSWAGRLVPEIARLREVVDVNSDIEMKSPRVNLVIDRDKAAALQLDANAIESTLYDGFGPRWSSTIYGTKAQYRVLLELDPSYQASTDALQTMSFKTPKGTLVPLDSRPRAGFRSARRSMRSRRSRTSSCRPRSRRPSRARPRCFSNR